MALRLLVITSSNAMPRDNRSCLSVQPRRLRCPDFVRALSVHCHIFTQCIASDVHLCLGHHQKMMIDVRIELTIFCFHI